MSTGEMRFFCRIPLASGAITRGAALAKRVILLLSQEFLGTSIYKIANGFGYRVEARARCKR